MGILNRILYALGELDTTPKVKKKTNKCPHCGKKITRKKQNKTQYTTQKIKI